MMISSPHMVRRFCCFTAVVASSSSSNTQKKRLVFMGSPHVSASVLDNLLTASSAPRPNRYSRWGLVTSSFTLIFTPLRASEEMFLSILKALEPDLCITAAYGNILPTKFLKIPSMGTVNIHPSLLPLYRGGAPVQRALQDGVKETGVSLAYTVLKLDAGPIYAQEKVDINDEIKAPDLLDFLFDRDGSAKAKALPQDESYATLAPKINPEESWLSFEENATVLHNKVRAFAGWPGTRANVSVIDGESNHQNNITELKIITTRVLDSKLIPMDDDVFFSKGSLVFRCGEGTALEVLEVELPGKRIVSAAAFWNGLRGQKLKTINLLFETGSNF